ncbi:MAG: UDP-3-O-(3-hydroxymyristoyl)glucosamine N-acyltransferase [Bacteroidota bacterium]
MQFSVKQISELLGGKIEGDNQMQVSALAELQNAKKGGLSFFSNKKYEELLYTTEASVVLVPDDFKPSKPVEATMIRVADPYSAFAQLLMVAEKQVVPQPEGIEPQSYIADTATLGDNCYVGAFAYIGNNVKVGDNTKIYPNVFIGDNVTIGEDCILYPGAHVMYNCVLGNHVTLHGGAIIGADGFGFAPQEDGSYIRIPQIGNVILEDYVSIGANATVDRATVSSTIIHQGVKLDNMVHIAHNCEVGDHTVMAAQVGIAGSVTIGKNCMFGGQSALSGHISIADDNKIGPKSALMVNVKDGGNSFLGSPGVDARDFFRIFASSKKLPDLIKRVQQLEKKLEE